VDNPSPLSSKIYDWVLFQTEAKKFDPIKREYIDQRNVTFNKVLFYNTEQISGVLTMVPKHNDSANYLLEQTKNLSATSGQIPLDRNERDWTVNDMRDLRIDYTKPMFIKNIVDLQSNYYIDKIVNPDSIDVNKDWTQLQSFRDKFLVVRLIFDTFADTRLIFNFSALDKKISER
jgi:16S rRNA G1207 methylase RsmC